MVVSRASTSLGFRSALLAFTAIVVSLLIAESALRMLRAFRPPRAVMDSELGWRINENIRRRTLGMRSDGTTYEVAYESGPHGFRFWGDPGSPRRKLLVVGDSFTDATQVSNDKTYYQLLANMLGDDWELFAYGADGYGTLQEHLILAEYVPIIRPDLVVWQWCSNDLWNNTYFLASRSRWNFSTMPRPFWEDGTIQLRYPHPVSVLSRHSQLWHFLVPRVAGLVVGEEVADVDRLALDSQPLVEARQVTSEIVSRTRTKVLGDTDTYAFIVSYAAEGDTVRAAEIREELASLARENGLHPVEGIELRLAELSAAGVAVDGHISIGGHWSEEGHVAAAQFLYDAVRRHANEEGTRWARKDR